MTSSKLGESGWAAALVMAALMRRRRRAVKRTPVAPLTARGGAPQEQAVQEEGRRRCH
jgi:MYXO-CTERM domain-containing protein